MTTIAIGGIMHESNTFSDTPTDYAAFSQTFASNLIKAWGETHHEMGGFIQGATQYDYTAYPTLMTSATPAGRVTDDAFDRFTEMLIQHLKAAPKHEGLLLALHGAMVAESYPDGDGEVLSADFGQNSVEIFRLLLRSTSTPTSLNRWSPNRLPS